MQRPYGALGLPTMLLRAPLRCLADGDRLRSAAGWRGPPADVSEDGKEIIIALIRTTLGYGGKS